ncbi:hypothetical protein QO000_001531 [Alkalihalobacillus hemicentroti]|uniref:Uncharacterized protein n=1 Tax=Guptibacillus hwajinpoensis TaxID=208199 RepID=A0ABU0K334_9BACL|nr:hypothetical protein [Alkalihalobacillus hemicentroti]
MKKKSSNMKDALDCFGWICLFVIPFWGMIFLSAELTGQHFLKTLMVYFK